MAHWPCLGLGAVVAAPRADSAESVDPRHPKQRFAKRDWIKCNEGVSLPGKDWLAAALKVRSADLVRDLREKANQSTGRR